MNVRDYIRSHPMDNFILDEGLTLEDQTTIVGQGEYVLNFGPLEALNSELTIQEEPGLAILFTGDYPPHGYFERSVEFKAGESSKYDAIVLDAAFKVFQHCEDDDTIPRTKALVTTYQQLVTLRDKLKERNGRS